MLLADHAFHRNAWSGRRYHAGAGSLAGQNGYAALADRAYASNALRETSPAWEPKAVIPSNSSRKIIIPHDETVYKYRNRIDRCVNRMKHFRQFATRYDRRTIHFKGFACLIAAMIWLR